MVIVITVDRETDHNGIQESRIGQHRPACTEVVTYIEFQLVSTTSHKLTIQQWARRSAIFIGRRTGHEFSRGANDVESNTYSRGRPAVRSIENMCCQASHPAPLRTEYLKPRLYDANGAARGFFVW